MRSLEIIRLAGGGFAVHSRQDAAGCTGQNRHDTLIRMMRKINESSPGDSTVFFKLAKPGHHHFKSLPILYHRTDMRGIRE